MRRAASKYAALGKKIMNKGASKDFYLSLDAPLFMFNYVTITLQRSLQFYCKI